VTLEQGDAFGRALLDQLEGKNVTVVVERDDGLVDTESMAWYLSGPRKWHASERQALRYVRGRVLDVGCGAGRVALHLQERGHDVVATDVSPLALEVCSRRGVRDTRLLPLARIGSSLGRFDTIVLFGNNFGLLASPRRARWLLRRLKVVVSEDARLLAGCHDPHVTDDPDNLSYHERNRRRGRLAGESRFRVRYGTMTTPWMDWLLVSPTEMEEIVAGTGWALRQVLHDEANYVGVIERASGTRRQVAV
jgi:SAM-dependent methyltransferase